MSQLSGRVSGWLRRALLSITLVAASIGPGAASVSGQVSIGAQGSWGNDTDAGIGARLSVGLGQLVQGLEIIGAFDYFFPGGEYGVNVTYWEINTSLAYRIKPGSQAISPYLGAGLNVNRFEASTTLFESEVSGAETQTHISLLGGLLFDIARVKPFMEGRIAFGEGGQAVASIGLRL